MQIIKGLPLLGQLMPNRVKPGVKYVGMDELATILQSELDLRFPPTMEGEKADDRLAEILPADAAVIEALLNISDSRFQPGLIEQAQKVGKLPKDFRIDPRFADNTPQRLQAIAARHPNLFPEAGLWKILYLKPGRAPKSRC